jgi:hypothetical protein
MRTSFALRREKLIVNCLKSDVSCRMTTAMDTQQRVLVPNLKGLHFSITDGKIAVHDFQLPYFSVSKTIIVLHRRFKLFRQRYSCKPPAVADFT